MERKWAELKSQSSVLQDSFFQSKLKAYNDAFGNVVEFNDHLTIENPIIIRQSIEGIPLNTK